MLKIKMLYRKPVEAEYKELKVYDNLDEYLEKEYDRDFVRIGYQDWKSVNVDEKKYYAFSYNSWSLDYEQPFLTEETYKKLLSYCKKTYKIYESDLFRTQKNSNTRFTGELSSIEEVIEYMNNPEKSWLPQICKEIDEDIEEINKKINELKSKINKLEEDKKKLYDEEYLKSNIRVEYTFDSQYYKSIKGLVEKVEE